MFNLCSGPVILTDDIIVPVINTGITTEWGTGFKSYHCWLDGDKRLFPAGQAKILSTNYMQRIGTMHFRFWDATQNTLAMLPEMYFCNRPQDSLRSHFFYDYTYSVYSYNYGSQNLYIHLGTPYKDSDVPEKWVWSALNSMYIVSPQPPAYPSQKVNYDLPVCVPDRSYASEDAYGYWLRCPPTAIDTTAHWRLYPYVMLVFQNWTMEDIRDYMEGIGSAAGYRRFGVSFLTTVWPDDGNLETRYIVDIGYNGKQTWLNAHGLDQPIYHGLVARRWTVLDTRTYGGNAYTVVFATWRVDYDMIAGGRISQPYFNIGYINSTIQWNTPQTVRNGVYVQEFGCEYWAEFAH